MARTVISVQQVSLSGIAPSFSAGDQANGHQFANDGRTFLEVKNTGGSACTVTIRANGYKIGGVTIQDQTVSVPATTGDRMIGPFDQSIFNQSGGVVNVDLSTGTGITIAAFKL